MPRKPGANSRRTVEALLRAAKDLLLADGIQGFSLRAVARRAGQQLSGAQYYFPKKEELLEAVFRDAYRAVDAEASDAVRRLERGEPLDDVAVSFTLALFRRARQHPNVCRARMVTNLAPGVMSGPSADALRAAHGRIQRSIPWADPRKVRLAIHSLSVLILRYGAHSDRDLMRLLDVDSPQLAVAFAEAHLAEASRGWAQQLERDRTKGAR